MSETFDIGFSTYISSLSILITAFGYGVEKRYNINVETCVNDLEALVRNTEVTVKEFEGLRESAKRNTELDIPEIKKPSIALVNTLNSLVKGLQVILSESSSAVDKIKNIINSI